MEDRRIFAYGTLLEAAKQRELFGRAVPSRPARLWGWRRVWYKDGYFGVVPSVGAFVSGRVMELDEAGFAAADRWEGYPRWYGRLRLPVDAGGTSLSCWVYIHQPTVPWVA